MSRRSRSIPRAYTFTVTGEGPFPFDMLRYDLCYPKSETDSHRLERTARREGRGQPHRITLVSSKAPTGERWGSFGWAVETVE